MKANTIFNALTGKEITLKQARAAAKYLNVNTSGNKKLKNRPEQAFIIWCLPAVLTCPYATKNCIKYCYAKRPEKYYPDCLSSRNRNFDATKTPEFVENMTYTLLVEIFSKLSRHQRVQIRIHESGDFYSQEYFNNWVSIVKAVNASLSAADRKRVAFMAYTKSFEYVANCNQIIPFNFTIRGSIWDDTAPDQVALCKSLGLPIYTAATENKLKDKKASGEKFHTCRCSDCATCRCCQSKTVKSIYCKIH